MQKVVSISLNGNSYQLEEPGYDQLRAYLERAEARLKDSPDRAEVMGDLEQAIGEKCARVLGPHKTVVSASESDLIIEEMGPVESADDQPSGSAADTAGAAAAPWGPPRKRLFKVREGEMWGGVCNGIAAYLGVDVTWVRIAAVILTLITSGIALVVYFALVFIVPYANTSEERAAAFGAPFSTEEFLNRAKKKSEEFTSTHRWRREWRRQQRHWQRQFDHMNAQVRQAAARAGTHVSVGGRAIAGVFVPIAALIGAVLFVAFLLGLFSLVSQHTLFGWELPYNMPLWVAIVGLIVAYALVSIPVRAIRYGALPERHPGWSALHTVLWICFALLLMWVVYMFVPGVREMVDQVMWATELTVDNIFATLN